MDEAPWDGYIRMNSGVVVCQPDAGQVNMSYVPSANLSTNAAQPTPIGFQTVAALERATRSAAVCCLCWFCNIV